VRCRRRGALVHHLGRGGRPASEASDGRGGTERPFAAKAALGALAIALGGATASCHVESPPRGAAELAGATKSGPERVFTRSVQHRPRISLVARLGDPSPAVAMAVAHDFGSEASTALGALVQARLRAQGFTDADSRPQALGFVVRALVTSPAEASRFVAAASHALLTPLGPRDPALPVMARQLAALAQRTWSGPAEAAIAACSGELGVARGATLVDPTTASGAARIEAWRRRVATARATAFAALGPGPVLSAAAEALVKGPAWPDGAEPDDAWPVRDVIGVESAPSGVRELSVALRIDDASSAIEAARSLGRDESALAARVAALDPAWRLERVVGTTRPRGACLRADLAASRTAPPPSLPDVARAAMVTLEEAKLALKHAARSPWTLDDSVLRPADPRQAAAVAAWRTLSDRVQPGAERRFVNYRAPLAQADSNAALARALDQTALAWRQQKLDTRARVEAGQGELWVLLASPCGTSSEGSGEAGLSAIAMRALAVAHPHVGRVRIEPWTTPDGVGLLAHSPRLGPNETPAAHAERVASALGRVLAVDALGGDAVARARVELRDELGPGPRPGFWLAVESVSPDHPSWLDARGTWQSITNATPSAVEQERREIVTGPLRLAVLADSSESQVGDASRAVERWLAPMRVDPHGCPRATPETPRHGELTVETSASTEPNGAAYVAIPIAPSELNVEQAKWTAYLLNRSGGWLDQALRAPGLASAARAVAIGGAHAAALVIEVTAAEDQEPTAVAQVRGLLQRLAEGAATAGDVAIARRHFARERSAEWLDPRYRIVELWRGRSADPPSPTLTSLRAFQRASFGPGTPVVVYVKQRE
jgi:hypothetical protein